MDKPGKGREKLDVDRDAFGRVLRLYESATTPADRKKFAFGVRSTAGDLGIDLTERLGAEKAEQIRKDAERKDV